MAILAVNGDEIASNGNEVAINANQKLANCNPLQLMGMELLSIASTSLWIASMAVEWPVFAIIAIHSNYE